MQQNPVVLGEVGGLGVSQSASVPLASLEAVSQLPGDWTFWLPSSAEEGRVLAQPAPGWCDRSLRKPPIGRFESQTASSTRNARMMIFGSPFRPPPCRCATAVAARHFPS